MTRRPFPHDPLSAEEREFADRLPHLASVEPPSATLDARILAAARAATPTRPHAPRWPALLGIAATLALAVGLAWQLRPAPEVLDAQDEVPTAAAPEPRSRSTRQIAPVPDRPTGKTAPKFTTGAAPPPPQPASEPVREAEVASPRDASARPLRDMPPPSRQGAAVDSAPRDARPPTMPAEMSEPAATAFPAATPPPPAPADLRRKQASGDSMAAQEAGSPSTAGSSDEVSEAEPLRPDAWLVHIRQLRDQGDADGAREGLERFVQAYPDRPLPDDLRALLDAPAR